MTTKRPVNPAVNIPVRSAFIVGARVCKPAAQCSCMKEVREVKAPEQLVASASNQESAVERRIREAGERARAEAEARRAKAIEPRLPKEIGGVPGPDPARYGDWEWKGVASDF